MKSQKIQKINEIDFILCSWCREIGKIFAKRNFYLYDGGHGSVAERFNAPVLKTDEGLYPSVSSNLTASARYENPDHWSGFLFLTY